MTANEPRTAGSPGGMGADGSLLSVARCLAIDADTAEVVTALRRASVRPLLLKGPTTARWLYPGEPRPYIDIDLMVNADDWEPASAVLEALGYSAMVGPYRLPGEPLYKSVTWIHPGRASVDLHRRFHGIADPDVFRVLARDTEVIDISGVAVEMPNTVGRALLLPLHAAVSGHVVEKTRQDLRRAVERLDADVWAKAASLAAELDCIPEFVDGLSSDPGGRLIVAELELSAQRSIVFDRHRSRAGGVADTLLTSTAPRRTRAAAALRRVFVSPTALRQFEPLAGDSVRGLAVGYAARLVRLAWRTPAAISALRSIRAERRSNSYRAAD